MPVTTTSLPTNVQGLIPIYLARGNKNEASIQLKALHEMHGSSQTRARSHTDMQVVSSRIHRS